MPALTTAKDLRAKRANLASRMNEILSAPAGADKELSGEQRVEFDRLHTEQNALKADVERIENHEALMADLGQSAGRIADVQVAVDEDEPVLDSEDEEARGTGVTTRGIAGTIAKGAKRNPKLHAAYDNYLRRGMARLNEEERTLMERRMVVDSESRAMGTNSETAGGYLVPEGFFNAIVEARLYFGGMRQSRATIVPTASGNNLPIPTDNDTSNTGELVGENNPATSLDTSIGQVMLNAYMYSSKIIKVSRQLLNDSAFPLQPYIARKFAQRLGRIQNTHFTTGDGASKPQGVVTGASSGVAGATGQTTSIIYGDIVDLEHSVDRDYRENAEWMMSDTMLKVIKKLKDGEGRPLWVPGLALRQPDSILGYGYVVNNDVAVPAASAKSLLFGDFSQYYIRDVQDILVLRLDERYAENLQVGFLAFARCDGKLVDAGTHPIKYYAHPAS
jgi:HK97 family phage major capsid protein